MVGLKKDYTSVLREMTTFLAVGHLSLGLLPCIGFGLSVVLEESLCAGGSFVGLVFPPVFGEEGKATTGTAFICKQ